MSKEVNYPDLKDGACNSFTRSANVISLLPQTMVTLGWLTTA